MKKTLSRFPLAVFFLLAACCSLTAGEALDEALSISVATSLWGPDRNEARPKPIAAAFCWLPERTTYAEVIQRVGPPFREYASGARTVLIYPLADGSSVAVVHSVLDGRITSITRVAESTWETLYPVPKSIRFRPDPAAEHQRALSVRQFGFDVPLLPPPGTGHD